MDAATKAHATRATPHLAVFLRAPRLGQVKTRLAREIGDEAALEVYRGLAEHQLVRVPTGWAVDVCYTPDGAGAEMRAWLGERRTYSPHGDGDLGVRLARALAAGFDRGAPAVLAIGGDCPSLDENGVLAAAEALRRVDVVLGPASDGGYYLVGLKQPHPALFQAIPWGTPAVFRETVERIRSAGLCWAQLQEREDVDDLASLRRQAGHRWPEPGSAAQTGARLMA